MYHLEVKDVFIFLDCITVVWFIIIKANFGIVCKDYLKVKQRC